jgi:hypothetical protein
MSLTRSFVTITLLISLAALFPAPVSAQQSPVRMAEETDSTGRRFTPPLPDKALPAYDRRTGQNLGQPAQVWIASEGVTPTVLPDKKETPPGARPIPFLEPFKICYRYQGKPRNYLLLASGVGGLEAPITPIGWVPEDLTFEGSESKLDTDMIHRKALLVNTPESLANRANPQTVPLRNAPDDKDDQVQVLHDLKVANYLFIWAEKYDRQWVLLGSGYFFDPGQPGQVRQRVLGWAPVNRVMFWKTREALEWDVASTLDKDSRRPLGYVFRTPEAAKEYLLNPKLVENPNSKFVEEQVMYGEQRLPDGTARELKPYEPRYPVLVWPDERQQTKYKIGMNELIHVAWIGGSGGDERIAALREKIRFIQEAMDKLDVLIIMDETGSMRDWYEDAARAVAQIVDAAKNSPAKSVRLAIAFYADDEVPGVKPAKPMELVDIHDQGDGLVAMLEKRARNPEDIVSGGGPREMVFNGIQEAVAGAKFLPMARKLVVVIGDDGDKSNERDPDHPGERGLSELLAKPQETACELLVLQVARRGEAGEAFATQMKTLGRLLDEQAGEKVSQYYELKDGPLLVRAVRQGYQELVARQQKAVNELEALRLGDATANLGPGLKKLLKDKGINPDDLKNVQVCQPGYVWKYADADRAVPQVNVRVLYSSVDIDHLLTLIKPVVEWRPGTIALKELYEECIRKAVQGGHPADEKQFQGVSFGEAVLQRKGLTVRSPLLAKDPGELSDRLIGEEHYQIKLRRKLLRDLQTKKVRQYKRKETMVAGVPYYDVEEVPGTECDLNRVYTLPGNTDEYYWIDFLKELP